MNKKLYHPLLLLAFIFFGMQSYAAPGPSYTTTITPSTCASNGSITVNTVGSGYLGSFRYEIISPITVYQNSNVFTSLPPGTYTVVVIELSGRYPAQLPDTLVKLVVLGNYKVPAPDPKVFPQHCHGVDDGEIIGNDTAGGTAPFLWRDSCLSCTPPSASAWQSSDTFTNLAPGKYWIQVMDSCGNIETSVAYVDSVRDNLRGINITFIHQVGCDSFAYAISPAISNPSLNPYTIKYTTSPLVVSGTTTLNYGHADTIIVPFETEIIATIYDSCGDSINKQILAADTVPKHISGPSASGCGFVIQLQYVNPSGGYLPFGSFFEQPDTVYVIGGPLNDTVMYINPATIPYPTVPGVYHIVNVDRCGVTNTWGPITVGPPPVASLSVTIASNDGTCRDSTASVTFHIANATLPGTLTILTGPAIAQSTAPAPFGYSAPLSYPQSYPVTGNTKTLNNFPVGTYTVQFVNSPCPDTLTATFTVTPQNVCNLQFTDTVIPGCVNDNTIKIHFNDISVRLAGGESSFKLYTVSTGGSVYANPDSDSYHGLSGGKYVFEMLSPTSGYPTLFNSSAGCTTFSDTIVVPPYINPQFTINDSGYCNGASVVILPDSADNKLPYTFQVASGPGGYTLPPASGNTVFNSLIPGIYSFIMEDACANTYQENVTVPGINLTPSRIIVNYSCSGDSLIFTTNITSSYYTYNWVTPLGSHIPGDTLNISPVTPASTGTYQIITTLSVGYCSSTADSSFNIPPFTAVSTIGDTTICAGNSVVLNTTVGTGPYTFNWAPPAGLSSTTVQSPTATPTATTIYSVVSTDSNGCMSTDSVTVTVGTCGACDSLHAHITFSDTSFCVGDSFRVYFSGGPYAELIIDSNNTGIVPIDSLFPGGLLAIPGDSDIGTHTFIFIVYASYPDSTSPCKPDTAYAYPVVKRCNCTGLNPTIASQQTGPLTWQFWSTSNPAPTFLQWYVDSTLIIQTTASDTFTYTFSDQGVHHVCMTGGYITPKADGTSFCCYETTCDTISIDYCNIWRSTDSIGYNLDSLNYHNVNFTYYGNAPTSMTWIFDNGDTIVNSGASVSELFTADGTHTASAYIVWSMHDSANCCCVDTIHLTFDVSPCNVVPIGFTEVDSVPGSPVFMSTFTNGTYGSYTVTGTNYWYVNGTLTDSGTIFNPAITTGGAYTISMVTSYTISPPLPPVSCSDSFSSSYNLASSSMRDDAFRIYPNPTNGTFLVEITSYDEASNAKLQLMDLTGQVVSQKSVSDLHKGTTTTFMDIMNLPQGIYQLRMIMGNSTQVNKLVKQ